MVTWWWTNIYSDVTTVCRIQKRLESGEIEYMKSHERETDPNVLERRQKQLEYGRNTPEYVNYCRQVPMWVTFTNLSSVVWFSRVFAECFSFYECLCVPLVNAEASL